MNLAPENLTVEQLRDVLQDAHLSFLLGAGASAPMFRLLGDVENILTAIEEADTDEDARAFARASVYAGFFKTVVQKNQELLQATDEAAELLSRYEGLLQTINRLLLQRRSSILNKQVNIFTTNIDLAIEVAAEKLQVHLNDGFAGRLQPRFSTSNFGSVVSRRSLQYDNLSEVPTFNLLKLHGSVSWAATIPGAGAGETRPEIALDGRLERVANAAAALDEVDALLLKIGANTTANELLAATVPDNAAKRLAPFTESYNQLAIVNPTKAKFQQTVLNQNYYDLLRLFSNELEKENSVLFVIGFSCRDEHIRELIIRSARANPTLQVIIFAYSPSSARDIGGAFEGYPITNSNIRIVAPPMASDGDEQVRYDLPTVVTEFFGNVVPTTSVPKQTVEVSVSVQEPLVAADE